MYQIVDSDNKPKWQQSLLVHIFSLSYTGKGPRCYSCTHIPHLRYCDTLQQCQEGQVLFYLMSRISFLSTLCSRIIPRKLKRRLRLGLVQRCPLVVCNILCQDITRDKELRYCPRGLHILCAKTLLETRN